MKILYHHRIASKDGQFVHVEELIRALENLGHEIIMIAPLATQGCEFGSQGRLVRVLKRLMPVWLYELCELTYNLIAYHKLSKAIRLHNPDCIYERYNLFLLAGIWVKRRYRLPLLLEVNAPLFDERSNYTGIALRNLARWTEEYAWRNADVVLPVSRMLAERIRKAGVESDNVYVIPNGIDPGRFSVGIDGFESKKRLGIEKRIVLGFTGFMREWHGLERVVALLADKLRNAHLLIVGDGPARCSIEECALRLGVQDRITITGVVSRDDVALYISAFDIALQPDVVEYASPLKLFEYLALGKAIVAPDKPNIREVLCHNRNAMLFDADDDSAFRTAIERLCEDSTLRTRLAQKARDTVREGGFTWKNNARKVVSLFREVGVEPNDCSHCTPSSSV